MAVRVVRRLWVELIIYETDRHVGNMQQVLKNYFTITITRTPYYLHIEVFPDIQGTDTIFLIYQQLLRAIFEFQIVKHQCCAIL